MTSKTKQWSMIREIRKSWDHHITDDYIDKRNPYSGHSRSTYQPYLTKLSAAIKKHNFSQACRNITKIADMLDGEDIYHTKKSRCFLKQNLVEKLGC